jgi:hypothetical protein
MTGCAGLTPVMRRTIAGIVTAAAKQMRNQYRTMARTLLPSLERQAAQLAAGLSGTVVNWF